MRCSTARCSIRRKSRSCSASPTARRSRPSALRPPSRSAPQTPAATRMTSAPEPPAIPGLVGLHHIAIAVHDVDAALPHWLAVTGGTLELRRALDDQLVDAASIAGPGITVELIAPLAGNAGVTRFL